MPEILSLPVLPLRGLLIPPHTNLRFDVGRPRSISAIEKAYETPDRKILLLTQINPDDVDPTEDKIYRTGTIAYIKEMNRNRNQVSVLMEGLERGTVQEFSFVGLIEGLPEDQQCLYADVEVMPEPEEESLDKEVLVKMIVEALPRYVKVGKKFTGDIVTAAPEITDLSCLTDMVVNQMPISIDEKQKYIEIVSPLARGEKLITALEHDIDIFDVEKRIQASVRKQMDKNQRDYYLREQIRAIQKELGDKEDRGEEMEKLRERLRKIVSMADDWREKIAKEINRLDTSGGSSAEASVMRNYVETVLGLPWDEVTEDSLDLDAAVRILDEDHFALEKPKERIIEFLAVRQMTKSLKGPILCLGGPPGVGKTSLAKSVARALGRKFVRLSLGGVRDEAEIRGHRRTYVGAIPGRIINAMLQVGVKNPVFLLDEIDKMSNDFRGDPASALLEVLDPEQNSTFSDHYVEMPFDLSQVLFITTANNVGAIPQPLLDRMELLSLSGYTEEEKLEIAKRHLVPKQLKEHGLEDEKLLIDDSAIKGIIEEYTREAGVRSLEREIARICRKSVVEIIRKPGEHIVVKREELHHLLGTPRFKHNEMFKKDQIGVATGLAWTEAGGDVMPIEVLVMPGKGQLTLTGKLGEVMKESAQTALSFVRSKAEQYGLTETMTEKMDIHIHVPENAVPKEGPSAGIALVTALVSAMGGTMVRRDVAMTGEITLRGQVLPIGGLKEKLLSAYRAGIKEVIIPEENNKDLDECPDTVKNKLVIHLVENYDQVLGLAIPSLASLVSQDDSPQTDHDY